MVRRLRATFPATFFIARLRATQPVHWNSRHNFWVRTRYQDVQNALRSSDAFSSTTVLNLHRQVSSIPEGARACFDICNRLWTAAVQASDDPQQTRQGNSMAEIFTTAAVEAIYDTIWQCVEHWGASYSGPERSISWLNVPIRCRRLLYPIS